MTQLWGSLSQGALPASVVKTTLHAIAQFLHVRQSSAVLPVPRQQRYFCLGFFKPHQRTKRKRACQLVAATNPPSLSVCTAAQRFPGGPVVGGASFGNGGRGHFQKVFEHDISALQSECAVLAQVLRDTPQDVPLDFSCQTAELRVNVPEKVLQGRTSAWSASVDSAWPLLVSITDCCTSRDTPVSWTHTAHSFLSELQTILRSAGEHSLQCRPAGGQLGSPEGAPGSPERAADSPDSLGRDSDSSSEYFPRQLGGTPQREMHVQETPGTLVFSPHRYTPLGSAEVERMLRRSQADDGAGDEPVTLDISPLPYTPLGSAEVQRMLKRARKQPRTARQLFQ